MQRIHGDEGAIRLAKKLFVTLVLTELERATIPPHTSAKIALIRYVVTVIPFVKMFPNIFII